MKRSLLFVALVAGMGFGCGDNKAGKEDKPAAEVYKDSLKQANLMYTKELTSLADNKNIGELLCQDWVLKDDVEGIENDNSAMGMLPYRSFYLAVDSTFTKNPRNAMDYGRWSFDEASKKITLNYEGGGKDVYKIGGISATELVVINSGVESITKLTFAGQGKRYKDKEKDPYYIANNQWRMAPRKPETDEAIRQRLKDCLHFYVLFYRDNLAREEKAISFYGLPTCIKWYAGGIFMVKEKDLAENWIKCFYNKEQAMKAYAMMEDIVTKKYEWTKGNMSWVKKNLLVLEQMEAKL